MDVKCTVRWPRAACVLALLAVAAVLPAAAGAETIYNNFPSPKPKNMASVGFEATSTSEFGGEVGFPALTARRKPTITVGMSSWACQTGTWSNNNCSSAAGSTFQEPVTLNVYEVGPGNTVGTKLLSTTQTFNMPYRPTASKKCTTGEAKGGYGSSCFHGKLFRITFSLPALVLPPEEAIVSVAYNTSDYGASPQRPQPCDSTEAGCPYDSLNVAVTQGEVPSVGTYPDPEEVDVNSSWNAMYCGNSMVTGSFGPSGKCWPNEQPVLTIKAK